YIDPPYNNGERYTHYRDAEQHEVWLQEMTAVLHKLKPFLRHDGSLWISIDDSEMHYLKVAADLVFRRRNFVSTVVWQQRTTRENRRVFSNNHEYILVYAKNPKEFKLARNMLPITPAISARYKNPDCDPRGPWQSVSANVQAGHAVKSQFYEVIAPNGQRHLLPNGRCWAYNKTRMNREIKNNNIWFGKDGCGVPRIKKFLSGSAIGVTPETLWLGSDVGTTKMAKKHLLSLFPDNLVFDTPKPEQLIRRIFDIATNEGDIVLDAFLGSGTSAAVAHKMKRQYVGIESGEHIVEYVVSRMRKVIRGEKCGISRDVHWEGGGGFHFYRLV
ncbi:MAG: site-specific DNA-methyltransferase, partial [Planctomycetota bacterium]|nr:site-specific DNA-methyltransferase [Planctomycetota bacterium]